MPRFASQGLELTLFPVSACEGQKGNVASAFDGCRHLALVFGARASLATWPDLAIISDVSLEKICLFIVDAQFFV